MNTVQLDLTWWIDCGYVNLRTMQRQLRLSSVPEPGEFGRWSIDLPDKRDGKWAVPHRLAVCDRWDCGWIAFSLIRRMVYRAFSFRFIQFSQDLQHRNGWDCGSQRIFGPNED